jgi:hypothetical protein
MASSGNGPLACVNGHVPSSIDHGHLPHSSVVIPRKQGSERCLSRLTHGHQLKAKWTVSRINKRLSSHSADAGTGPRNDGTNGKPVGLNGDA